MSAVCGDYDQFRDKTGGLGSIVDLCSQDVVTGFDLRSDVKSERTV